MWIGCGALWGWCGESGHVTRGSPIFTPYGDSSHALRYVARTANVWVVRQTTCYMPPMEAGRDRTLGFTNSRRVVTEQVVRRPNVMGTKRLT